MPNPNIVNVSVIRGQTAYCIPSTANANTVTWTFDGTAPLTGLTPAAGNVHRITSLVAANMTGNAASAKQILSILQRINHCLLCLQELAT